jgi:hypothetical protein
MNVSRSLPQVNGADAVRAKVMTDLRSSWIERTRVCT